MPYAQKLLVGIIMVAGFVISARLGAAQPVGIAIHHAEAEALPEDLVPKDTVVGSFDWLFASTPVGHTTTDTCFILCVISQGGGNGLCGSQSGTISEVSAPGSPFSAANFRVATIESNSCNGTPVTLPASIGLGQVLIFDLSFSPSQTGNFTSTLLLGTGGGNDFAFDLFGSSLRSVCTASNTTMCSSFGRFAVSATFTTATGSSGAAHVVPLTQDTGSMWFFSPANIELETKIVNGCALNGHYWFFAGGLTNVKVDIAVRDTVTGQTRTYHNPQGTAFLPIQDTSAFSSCP